MLVSTAMKSLKRTPLDYIDFARNFYSKVYEPKYIFIYQENWRCISLIIHGYSFAGSFIQKLLLSSPLQFADRKAIKINPSYSHRNICFIYVSVRYLSTTEK